MIPELLPIWQPKGYSTHIIAKKVAEKYGVKTSHTGTLDPMAEGVIIVLLGENRHKKYEFAAWEKEYEFEIAFGIATDSFDGLGLVTDVAFPWEKVNFERLSGVIESFLGEYEQKVPAYSAIKVDGKPMHWYARSGKLGEVEIPQRKGRILEIELLELVERPVDEVLEGVVVKVKRVTGDLRQSEVVEQWEKIGDELEGETVQIAKVRVKMTKGLYVRQLSMDICERLNCLGFVTSLVRVSNGEFTIENSLSLEEIFGENLSEKIDFVSMV